MAKIGIGISTYNRRDTALKAVRYTLARIPRGTKVVIVDDNSTVPFPKSPNYTLIRNDVSRGVAGVKNQCLEALKDCDYIFLLDDDIYPKTNDWCEKYINASQRTGVGHFMHLRVQRHPQQRDGGNSIVEKVVINGQTLVSFGGPSGMMLFMTKECFQTVGGFDSHYPRWGCEHVGWSHRAHNLGFTKPGLWLDIDNSKNLFYSYDFDEGHACSITFDEQKAIRPQANEVFEREKRQKEWKPFAKDNFVLTSLLSGIPDHQGRDMSFNSQGDIQKWADSVARNGFTGIVFTNEAVITATDHLKPIYVPKPTISPYQLRWELALQWLTYNRDLCGQVWLTDGTDVEMLAIPEIKPRTLYVGLDDNSYDCEWARNKGAQYPPYRSILAADPKRKLLNAGIVGGEVGMVIDFLKPMVKEMAQNRRIMPGTDMPQFNHIVSQFHPVYGPPVTTPFKSYTTETNGYWWKHK